MKQIIAVAVGLIGSSRWRTAPPRNMRRSIPASAGSGQALFNYFQQDDAVCQQWANQQAAYAQQQAGNQVGGGAVAGAIGGALLGGLLGGGRAPRSAPARARSRAAPPARPTPRIRSITGSSASTGSISNA